MNQPYHALTLIKEDKGVVKKIPKPKQLITEILEENDEGNLPTQFPQASQFEPAPKTTLLEEIVDLGFKESKVEFSIENSGKRQLRSRQEQGDRITTKKSNAQKNNFLLLPYTIDGE